MDIMIQQVKMKLRIGESLTQQKLDLFFPKCFLLFLLVHKFNHFPYSLMQNSLAFSSFPFYLFHFSSNGMSLHVQFQARQTVSKSLIFMFSILPGRQREILLGNFSTITFYVALSSKVPIANGYQNEMQLRADSSERNSLFGDSEVFHKSQGGVSCLCSHYLFRQVDGEPCFPKTPRIDNCYILDRMLLSSLQVSFCLIFPMTCLL